MRFNNKEGGIELGQKPHLDIVDNGKYLLHEDYSHRELIAKAYINSIQYLLDRGKKVILIYPVPEAGWNVPDYMIRFYLVNPESVFDESTASTSYKVFIDRNKKAIDALDKIEPNNNLFRVRPDNILCNSKVTGRCVTHSDGLIFYKDDDHLSDAGAKLLLEQVVSIIK